jgi:hypothetical protein
MNEEGFVAGGRGTLDHATFEGGAEHLIQLFDLHRHDQETGENPAFSGWKILRHVRCGTYLIHEMPITICMAVGDQRSSPDGPLLLEDDTVLRDSSTAFMDEATEPETLETSWNLSIVYSHTYRVPVLYFSVQYLDGSPCLRDSLVAFIRQSHHQNRVVDSWNIISAEQHPVTGLPSFFLHPCATSDWMKLLVAPGHDDNSILYLLSWMSMVLATIGLPIPARVYKSVLL